MRMNMKSEKGFSLIELLVTIAIASALSALAILYTPGIVTGYKVRGATRLIYSDMQMARLQALKEGKEMAVEFVSATSYCVKRKAGANWVAGCGAGGDVISKTVDISGEYSGVTALNVVNGNRVNFMSNGTAGATANVNPITLQKDTRRQFLCNTTGTGRIMIVDGTSC
jgi:type IV fimbrial biogenesis protein FimT